MKANYFTIVLFLVQHTLFGQSVTNETEKVNKPLGLQVSSIFNNTMLGLSLGISTTLKESEDAKKKNPSKTVRRKTELLFQADYLSDDRSNKYAFFRCEYSMKRYLKGNLFIDIGAGAGVARSFSYDSNYISATGNNTGNHWAGNWYFIPFFSVGSGYTIPTSRNVTPFLNFHYRPLIPEYRFLRNLGLMELGVSIDMHKKKGNIKQLVLQR